MRCILCDKKSQIQSICQDCKKNPFLAEEYRKILAKDSNLEELAKTYSKEFAFLSNINSSNMWDALLGGKRSLTEQNPITLERIKKTVKLVPKKAKQILDIGIGYGFVPEKLMAEIRGINLFGIDIAKETIKDLRKKFPYGNFKIGDILKIPYENNKFDCILALEVFEHLSPLNVFEAYKEIKRVLKDKGDLILSVPINEDLSAITQKCPRCGILMNPNGHLRSYTPELIKAELTLAGLKIDQLEVIYPFVNKKLIKNMIKVFIPSRWAPSNIIVRAVKK